MRHRKGGKIGLAGNLAGLGGARNVLLFERRDGARLLVGIKGDMEKGGKNRTRGNFGGNFGGAQSALFLSGAAGVLAYVGPAGHKRRHGKGGKI
jgi:hypothetical protein